MEELSLNIAMMPLDWHHPLKIFIHNHLVPCGTHSSLGVDILAPFTVCCRADSPILFTVAVWGVRVYFKSPCIIEPGAGIY